MSFPEILAESVWHTTTPERYASILRDRFILPEPELTDSERWGTAMGESHYPYVRSIGGVSLFDFRGFDEFTYSERYPMSSWHSFVPCSHRSDEAIWLEIDVKSAAGNFLSGRELLNKWKESEQLRRKIMPFIEAAHLGPLPLNLIRRTLKYSKSTGVFEECFALGLNNA
ncbi:hypothetical protein [Pseudomaricurvus sp.]|uniref:hypothetical protein n=1 Tax=Pseudomaricurvus sp. TaxID=2004510 RepID=UPI003F6D781F